MIKIKNFAIFKNKPSENEKAPSHALSAKIGEQYLNIGSAWTKEGKSGKFLSVQLSNAYVDHTDNTRSRKSVVLIFEEDLAKLYAKAGLDYVNEADVPKTPPVKQQEALDEAF